jgi:citrate lyase beta subunit
MTALRSLLRVVNGTDASYESACATAADAILVDLDASAIPRERSRARRALRHHSLKIATANIPLVVRVGDTRSGEIDADLDAAASKSVFAVILSATDEPQDARDADVAIRRHEMRLGITPGTLRLICEIDSTAGLAALPRILEAVDRHLAAMLAPLAIAMEIGSPASAAAGGSTYSRVETLVDHVMAQTALTTAISELPWLISAPDANPARRAALATRAHQLGATGIVISSEAEARGTNVLFTPDPDQLATMQAVLTEWERLRKVGRWSGEVDGKRVDRRTVRRARARLTRLKGSPLT